MNAHKHIDALHLLLLLVWLVSEARGCADRRAAAVVTRCR